MTPYQASLKLKRLLLEAGLPEKKAERHSEIFLSDYGDNVLQISQRWLAFKVNVIMEIESKK